MTAPARSRAARRGCAALAAAVLGVGLLSGCADQEPEPSPPAPAATPSTPAAPATPAPSSPATPATEATPTTSATTPLPGMPTPVSVGDSRVDSARLRSIDDLATVFACPSAVPPIRLPATPAPTGASGATVPAAPDAIVCASGLADKEALFLWYVPTPEAKLGALTAALDRARYVHAGPNWVAAGMINAQMGTVGGEVYR